MWPRMLTYDELVSLVPARSQPKYLGMHVASQVKVSWAWYNQGQGVVEWTFKNNDTANQHSVVLLRNGYYFGGAFWPVYLANPEFDTVWAVKLQPMPDHGPIGNAPPCAVLDFDGRQTVAFVFTLSPGQSWSMLEGGFSEAMSPSGISLYEVTQEYAGPMCVGYDPQRVTDWDLQTTTPTLLGGYSPNPSTVETVQLLPESDAPYDVLPFHDSIAVGTCSAIPQNCSEIIQEGVKLLEAGDLVKGADQVIKGIECLGVNVRSELLKRLL